MSFEQTDEIGYLKRYWPRLNKKCVICGRLIPLGVQSRLFCSKAHKKEYKRDYDLKRKSAKLSPALRS